MVVLAAFGLEDEFYLWEKGVEVHRRKVSLRREYDFVDSGLGEGVGERDCRLRGPCPRRDSSVFIGCTVSQWYKRSVVLSNEECCRNIRSWPPVCGVEDVAGDPVLR
jgi:hypothetical protein